jgi:hypothetical protein
LATNVEGRDRELASGMLLTLKDLEMKSAQRHSMPAERYLVGDLRIQGSV